MFVSTGQYRVTPSKAEGWKMASTEVFTSVGFGRGVGFSTFYLKYSIQCSRLKPSYEYHLEWLSNFSPSVEGLVQIQDVNLGI